MLESFSMDTPILSGGTTLPSTSVTNYGYIQGNLNTFGVSHASTHNIIPFAGTLKNLRVELGAAPSAGKNWVFTITVNGTDTGITCTIADAATTASDLVNTATVAASDTVSIKCVPTGTPTSPVSFKFSLEFSAGASISILLGSTRASNVSNSATEYHGLQMCGLGDATIGNRVQVIPTGGNLRNLWVELSGAPGVGATYVFTLVKNGTPQTLAVTITGNVATSGSDLVNSIAVVAGDLVCLQCVPTVTPTARIARWGLKWEPTIDGEALILGCNGAAPNTAGSVRYEVPTGTSATWGSTESAVQSLTSAFTLKKLYVDLTVAPGGAASYNFKSRKNAANGALTTTITGAATTGNDTTNSDTFAGGNSLAISSLSASTPAATVARWGLVAYNAPATTFNSRMFLVFD